MTALTGRGAPGAFGRHSWTRGLREPLLVLGGALLAALIGVAVVRYGAKTTGAGLVALVIFGLAFVRVEGLVGLLYLVSFVGPAYLGNAYWPRVLLLVVVVLAARILISGARPILSLFLGIYGLVYLFAALHGDWNSATVTGLRSFLIPPLFALCIASLARDAAMRKRLFLMTAPLIALQIPVSALQVLHGASVFGRTGFNQFSDAITGTFGDSASGVLSLVTVAFATVLFALALERVWRPKLLIVLAIAFAGVGVLSVARAVFLFVPIAFGTVLIASGFIARNSVGFRRIAGLSVMAVLATSGVLVAMTTLYPGVTNDINSAQKLRDYLFLPNGPNPERAGQLQAAIDSVRRGGANSLLLGEGVGTSSITADRHVTSSPGTPLVLRPEQETNSVWLTRILVETGIFGVAAFVALMLYLLRLAKRGRRIVPPRTFDSALLLSLPGLAALTLAGGLYQTVLDSPPYATLFWLVVGLCLAATRQHRVTAGDTAVADR